MKAFLAFLLIPLSFVAYMALALRGVSQQWAIPHFLVAGLSLVLLGGLLKKKFTWPRLGLNVLGWALTAFIAWWIVSYSAYPPLPDKLDAGRKYSLSGVDLRKSKATLLVFYRGHW